MTKKLFCIKTTTNLRFLRKYPIVHSHLDGQELFAEKISQITLETEL